MLTEVAPAKINLALHVRARDANGYHQLETVFAFCEHGDVLTLEPTPAGSGMTMEVMGPFASQLAPDDDNLVLRAARAMADHFGVTQGAHFTLDKRLPIASGIGGGSADAAAAMRLLRNQWSMEIDRETANAIAGGLGADIPACLASVTVRGLGYGDVLTFDRLPSVTGTPILLVNPGVAVSTAAIFRAWGGVGGGPLDDPFEGRNDLEPIARGLAPVIGDVLNALEGARLARMSGSGATCFGLYDTIEARDAAAKRIETQHPDWWQLPSRIRG